jgi:alpha-L-rhamnosidase
LKSIINIFFLLLPIFAQSQLVEKYDWQASWVAPASFVRANTFTKYRAVIDLDEIKNVTACVATDSKYWLWINETLIIFEGGLKRGPTPSDTYFDELDLTQHLKRGKNTICVLVWFWGKDGFSHKNSGKSALLFDLKVQNKFQKIEWVGAQHKAFQYGSAPYPNFRLPESNIHYDARLDNEDWLKVNFVCDTSWISVIEVGKAGCFPWNKLYKRPIPQWKNSELLSYETIRIDTNLVTGKKQLIGRLPKNVTVTPYLEVNTNDGELIEIRTDNYFGGSEPNIRTDYVARKGAQKFESPAYFNGHEVIYTMPINVNVVSIKYRLSEYDASTTGSFISNDVFLNTLWQKSVNTLRVNLRDGIFDSPDRERAQWWGDIVINLEEMQYCLDTARNPLIKKSISNLLEWQKKSGELFSPIPAGNWSKELPGQMLAAVSKYGIWNYVLHSGDTSIIRYAYPFIQKYLSLYKIGANGLVEHRTGDWDWHDWGDKVDVEILDNAWFYLALDGIRLMANFLKLENDVTSYSNILAELGKNIKTIFWNGRYFSGKNYKYKLDDRANGLLACAGLVTKAQWHLIKPYLDTTFNAGPYLEKYICEAYCLMGDAEAGFKRLTKRYRRMVDDKYISTLWEGWEIGSATFGGGTYNHGWTGGPLSLMSAYIAGVKPTNFAYASYSIKPQLMHLENINCTVPTMKGFINVDFKVNGKPSLLIKTINGKGEIAIPKRFFKKRITVNGKVISKVFKYLNEDDEYFYYLCQNAGKYLIK